MPFLFWEFLGNKLINDFFNIKSIYIEMEIDNSYRMFGFESNRISIESGSMDDRERTSSILSMDSIESDVSYSEDAGLFSSHTTQPLQYIPSKQIAIHNCVQSGRKRDMLIIEGPKTPTPSKYYTMIQENNKLLNQIKK